MKALPLVLVLVSAMAAGCVHAPRLNSIGREPYMFWPPPRATSVVESGAASTRTTMGERAAAVTANLQGAGYTDVRWYPIGTHYEHGFAVTTRIERREGPPAERWPETYPEPVELRWLEAVGAPKLPAGRYRALLVAFTDLPPTPAAGPAPIWDSTTVMETGNPAAPLPSARLLAPTFREQTFAYEYAVDP